jgi:hypothetical protein
MKDTARTLALLAVCALGAGSVRGADSPPPKPVRLEISLTDGSLLLGETSMPSISLISGGMGKIDVRLGFISAISFAEGEESASVTFRNGDKIRANIAGVTALDIKTLFGPVSIPVGAVREIHVHPGGTGKLVDWDILPFPKGSDWPGARGGPATVNADEMVLQGQPVCTKQSFSAPLSFECDATLDKLVSDDGCLWIDLVPDGPDAEQNVPPQNVAIQLGYHHRGDGGGMLTIASMGAAPVDMGKDAFELVAGKAYHLQIDVEADTIRATLDGQVFESKTTLPFKSFHIEVMGWQPTNTWHIRDFIVH